MFVIHTLECCPLTPGDHTTAAVEPRTKHIVHNNNSPQYVVGEVCTDELAIVVG